MVKDIVVNLSIAPERDVAADYALSVAQTFGAEITGLAFAYEPLMPATALDSLPAEIIEKQRLESDQAARLAIAAFEDAARSRGLKVQSEILDATLDGAPDTFGSMARIFDVSVLAQADPDGSVAPEQRIIEAALFQSGHPTIIVPYIQKDALSLDRVLVCWDGSRPASRAVSDALPFLARAEEVEVITVVKDDAADDDRSGKRLVQHLARHDIKAQFRRIPMGDIDAGSAILSYVSDSATSLMVMGGYGHSRLRELMLGGVSRRILDSMTVPVLMSH
ncbi:MAG TPA: universal stress protein [Xanthobacteraceae bacterium]|jgi:nucleotide-binding universal stress UspA family protein|nr:universal stress protein [Xanthobacteraceae bacterium]